MQDAGTAGATEIAASKLALQRSTDRQVKDFGQRMIADHTKGESEKGNDPALKAAAAKALPVISHHYAMAQQLAESKAAS